MKAKKINIYLYNICVIILSFDTKIVKFFRLIIAFMFIFA